MGQVARHVTVIGRVQGVFFRAWTQRQAEALGISGWVRNCPDGRVDAHVEGEEAAVQLMIDKLHLGPQGACVEDVRLWNVEACDFDGFEVRH